MEQKQGCLDHQSCCQGILQPQKESAETPHQRQWQALSSRGVDEWADGGLVGWTEGWKGGKSKKADGWLAVQTDKQLDGQMNGKK